MEGEEGAKIQIKGVTCVQQHAKVGRFTGKWGSTTTKPKNCNAYTRLSTSENKPGQGKAVGMKVTVTEGEGSERGGGGGRGTGVQGGRPAHLSLAEE